MSFVSLKTKLWLIIIAIGFSTICQAIGFGNLRVYSYLDEPLVAEIELTNFKDIDPSLLRVGLASQNDFNRSGIERGYFLNFLNFNIVPYHDHLLIFIRSAKPVNVPYLEFLIELSWPEGNLIKDYTLLIDPPPPNLDSATRAKALSELAIEQQNKTAFAPSVAEQQLEMQRYEQQKQAAQEELAAEDVVKFGPHSFGDTTIDGLPNEKSMALVPAVVPEVNDDEIKKEIATRNEVQKRRVEEQKRIAAQKEYQKQRAEFEKEQAQSQEQKTQASKTALGKVTHALESVKHKEDADVHGATKPATATTTSVTGPSTAEHNADHEEIDFSHVIQPQSKAPAPAVPAQMQAKSSQAVPIMPTKPANASSASVSMLAKNHFYVGVILCLLLIAAAVAVAAKRLNLIHNKSNAVENEAMQVAIAAAQAASAAAAKNSKSAANQPNEYADAEPEFTEDHETEEIDLSAATDPNLSQEHSGTTAVPPVAPTVNPIAALASVTPNTTAAVIPSNVELDKFETEFENLDLDKLASSEPEPAPQSEAIIASATPVTPEPPLATAEHVEEIPSLALAEEEVESAVPEEEQSAISLLGNFNPTAAKQKAKQKEETKQEEGGLHLAPSEEYFLPASGKPDLAKDLEVPDLHVSSGEPATPDSPVPLEPTPTSESVATDESIKVQIIASGNVDNSEAIKLKIELAKQYLDAGESESAKQVLREVVERGDDEQKLEAQILLSGII